MMGEWANVRSNPLEDLKRTVERLKRDSYSLPEYEPPTYLVSPERYAWCVQKAKEEGYASVDEWASYYQGECFIECLESDREHGED
jgi:hypothetical protein